MQTEKETFATNKASSMSRMGGQYLRTSLSFIKESRNN